ncbi:MAG TPA: hypothetical protein VJI71_02205, partial [Candidatus Norongarragalinales archaeon]|nr:hypothetical protein [Candidatus Norongarragalinales archaeon]
IRTSIKTCNPGHRVYFLKGWGASAVAPAGQANRAAVEIRGKDNALVAVVEVRRRFKPVIHFRDGSAWVAESIAKALKFHGGFLLTPTVKKYKTIESPEKLLRIRR